jgi:membrane-associated protein
VVGTPLWAHRLACAAVITAVNWLSPHDLIETFGTIGLILVVFVESGLIPAPLPGDSILFLAGAFCATSQTSSDPHLNLAVVVVGSFIAAVVGAQLGYALGHRYGTRLFKPDARIFKTAYLERAQEFFEHRGPRAVVLARFIPFVRTIVPMLAGAGHMPLRKYTTANVVGAAIWAAGISLLGFWLGKSIDIDKYLYPIVAVIIVLSFIPPFLEYRKHKRSQSPAS